VALGQKKPEAATTAVKLPLLPFGPGGVGSLMFCHSWRKKPNASGGSLPPQNFVHLPGSHRAIFPTLSKAVHSDDRTRTARFDALLKAVKERNKRTHTFYKS
jgi:hypothetical protein